MTRDLILRAALIAFALSGSSLEAQVAGYSVRWRTNDHLYEIDLTTGQAADLGPVGLSDAKGLTAIQSEIYAIGGEVDELWNLTPPPGRRVGTTGAGLQYDAGLAYDITTRTLYALKGTLATGTALYTIDVQTGMSNLVGTSPIFADGFAIDDSGRAYATNFIYRGGLYQVDLATGALRSISNFPTNGNLFRRSGLAFDDAGALWALTADAEIFRLDPTTGATTFVETVRDNAGAPVYGLGGLAVLGRVRYAGRGCKDQTGTELRMRATGLPVLGATFRLRCDYASNTPYVLTGGLSDQIYLGVLLPVDLSGAGAPGCSIYISQELGLGSFPAGAGVVAVIPVDPTLVGVPTHWQAMQFDPGLPTPLPLAFSDYAIVRIAR